ncbi:hypothetical protein C4D60_Mb09t00090 [Musa balbisiana]|uniref:Uncharacterized protein n=1 Tax=Musa balbisiana TaxID=52838 RepID=A0A4S8IDQ3_MUSBA|nr:hypothetical protein C4D60_Mb09t00090 [Musa balbisiana]
MAGLPAGELGAPYGTRWPDLKADSRIWADGPTAQEFIQGALHPIMAKELYCSTSERQHYVMALIDRVLNTGWVIERQADTYAALRLENQELRSSFDPEVMAVVQQQASALDEGVSHLKAELEESQSHVRTLDDPLARR